MANLVQALLLPNRGIQCTTKEETGCWVQFTCIGVHQHMQNEDGLHIWICSPSPKCGTNQMPVGVSGALPYWTQWTKLGVSLGRKSFFPSTSPMPCASSALLLLAGYLCYLIQITKMAKKMGKLEVEALCWFLSSDVWQWREEAVGQPRMGQGWCWGKSSEIWGKKSSSPALISEMPNCLGYMWSHSRIPHVNVFILVIVWRSILISSFQSKHHVLPKIWAWIWTCCTTGTQVYQSYNID